MQLLPIMEQDPARTAGRLGLPAASGTGRFEAGTGATAPTAPDLARQQVRSDGDSGWLCGTCGDRGGGPQDVPFSEYRDSRVELWSRARIRLRGHKADIKAGAWRDVHGRCCTTGSAAATPGPLLADLERRRGTAQETD
jgi:hypothetical protein